MSDSQVIFVGSGINSLVGAALLAARGKRVLVLERSDRLGGCIRTEELFAGYQHEVLSSWYPLFIGSPGYAELNPALEKVGLQVLFSEYSTGLVRPDGSGLALKDLADTVRRLDALEPGDGQAIELMAKNMFGRDAALTFGLLGKNPYGLGLLKLLFSEWRKRGVDGLMAFAAGALESFRRWSAQALRSDTTRALIAPWALHSGLGPDDAGSALIGKLTFAAVVSGGMPVIKGGGSRLVEALAKIIEQSGGQLLTGTHVERVLVEGQGRKSRATGVRLSDGRVFAATDAVVCNVTPQQLYGGLLPDVSVEVRERAAAYRYGRAAMQIHFSLSEPPAWLEEELLKVPVVHMTESMEQVSASATEANNGWLPARPTLVIGQPVVVDVSRAPEGGWILWVQLLDVPSRLKGDAAGLIEVPADGHWSEEVREAFADRVQARMEQVMPGLGSRILDRRSYSPADLEQLNCNLVGGDPYSGVCTLDQFVWLRPFASAGRARANRTPVKNVFHIGGSTHPGPGLGAGSGVLVAQAISPAK